jgi:hypothetical protein
VKEQLLRISIGSRPSYEAEMTLAATPVAPRPLVYLDQNHWITLSHHRHGSGKVRPSERAAAERLIALGSTGAVLLPLSAAHYVETMRRGGPSRVDLAETMTALSRGWIMRNPVAVRKLELQRVFEALSAGARPKALDVEQVFTLDNRLITADGPGDAGAQAPSTLEDATSRIATLLALHDTLFEPDSDRAGDDVIKSWAATHNDLAASLHATKARRDDIRVGSLALVLGDLHSEIAEAAHDSGMSSPDLESWVRDSGPEGALEQSLRSMPYLSRLRLITQRRLTNPGDLWESNDLNDLHFLATAAGYADVVVGEKRHSAYLDEVAKGVTPGAVVVRNLETAVPIIDGLLSDD